MFQRNRPYFRKAGGLPHADNFVWFQSIFQRRAEVLFRIGPFQHGGPHFTNTASFLKGPERAPGFMEDKTKKTQIKGIIAEWKSFGIGNLKMSFRNESSRGFEHRRLEVDSCHMEASVGEHFGENAAARSNVENFF